MGSAPPELLSNKPYLDYSVDMAWPNESTEMTHKRKNNREKTLSRAFAQLTKWRADALLTWDDAANLDSCLATAPRF